MFKQSSKFILTLFVFFCKLKCSLCSLGDSFPYYRTCVSECSRSICDEDGYHKKERSPSYFEEMFEWQCTSECRYVCMWDLVEAFERKGWNVPQFHGKWPFVRWWGLQEPVSMIASVIHLLVTIYMFRYFYKRVCSKSPMYWIWVTYAVVLMNCWTWSALFHARDLPFNEIMDYISAFAAILFGFFAIGYRVLLNSPSRILFSICCLLYFLNHTLYRTLDENFDYAYNMKANIVLSIMTSIIIFAWTIREWKNLYHVRYALYYMINFMIAAIPEILDFPPILWLVDAHALWHILSIPVTYFLFMYGVEDCRYLHRSKLHL